eukprot:m.116142 g.116142  ORF g.116142 m.116142 type:complete len:518 (+) comp16372_c0_seq6:185-1738(+)
MSGDDAQALVPGPRNIAVVPVQDGLTIDAGSTPTAQGLRRHSSLAWMKKSKVSPLPAIPAVDQHNPAKAGLVAESTRPLLLQPDGSLLPADDSEIELKRCEAIYQAAEQQVQLWRKQRALADQDAKRRQKPVQMGTLHMGLEDTLARLEHLNGVVRSEPEEDALNLLDRVCAAEQRVRGLLSASDVWDTTDAAKQRWTWHALWRHPWQRLAYAGVFYLAVGLAFYAGALGWPFVQALYFVLLVGTGSGSCHHPLLGSSGAKVFTSAYLLAGLFWLVAGARLMIDWIHATRNQTLLEAKKIALFCVVTGKDPLETYHNRRRRARAQMAWPMRIHAALEHRQRFRAVLYFVAVMACSMAIVAPIEGLRFINALLWGFTASTSSSLRDSFLNENAARVLASLLQLVLCWSGVYLAYTLIASLVGGVDAEVDRILQSSLVWNVRKHCSGEQDQDRPVDLAYWQSAMLVSAGLVDQETLDLIALRYKRQESMSDQGHVCLRDLCAPVPSVPEPAAQPLSFPV